MASLASRLFGWWNEAPEVHHLSKKPVTLEAEATRALTLPPNPTSLDVLSVALSNGAAIDVIERLTALREKELARAAESAFAAALARIQAEIRRVAPDLQNPSTSSRYASYAAIDRIVRPIYTREGMSLSFSHTDSPKPEHVRVLCFASLGSYTRTYQIDMPTDGKGARGGDVMTKTHAMAAADSYAKRYLIKDVFNIAIGEEDTDGNPVTNGEIAKHLDAIAKARSIEELKSRWKAAMEAAGTSRTAQLAVIQAKDARKRELQ